MVGSRRRAALAVLALLTDMPIAGAPWGPVKASGRTGALARVFCCLFAQLFAFESYMCSCSLAFVILFSDFV